MSTSRRFLMPLYALALVLLSACASNSGVNTAGAAEGTAAAAGRDIVTASDESPARKQARTRLELASGYFSEGKTTIALDELKLALQADPNYAEAFNMRGLVYARLGEIRLAEDSFRRALQLTPRDGDTLHNYGFMLCQQRRFDEGIGMLSQAVALPLYSNQSRSYMARGLCEQASGRKPEAERSFARSFELDAANPISGFNLAKLLYERGDYTRAQFYVKRLNDSEFANEQTLWLAIKAERRLGNTTAVQQLGTQLRRRYPQSKELGSFERGAFDE
jgi:type IV pilus assembly protein PilF